MSITKRLINLLIAVFLIGISGCHKSADLQTSSKGVVFSHFTDSDGWQIWQLNIQNNQVKQLSWSSNEAYYPSLFQNGELAYSDHNGHIWLLSSGLGSKEQQAEQILSLPKYCGHPAVSPDGLRLF